MLSGVKGNFDHPKPSASSGYLISGDQSHFSAVMVLLKASLACTTCRTDVSTLTDIVWVVPGTSLSSPAPISVVLSFIVHLQSRGLSLVSIRSKLSAIAFWHQLNDWSNPINCFLVHEALAPAANSWPPVPPSMVLVSPNPLECILAVLPSIGLDRYHPF